MKRLRIQKSLHERVSDLDHHLFLLRHGLRNLFNDEAYLKSVTAELRVLVCLSSGRDGLIWRLADELGVSDEIILETAQGVDREHPLTQGLQFATIPLNRPGCSAPGIDAEKISLREVFKEFEAIYISSITDKWITHENLISAIAQQMGSAHEDDGIEPKLHRLKAMFINGLQPYYPTIALDAELTLQIGERILDAAEQLKGYRRKKRRELVGDVSLVIKCSRTEPFLGSKLICSVDFCISEVELQYILNSRALVLRLSKRGLPIGEYNMQFEGENEMTVFAATYSSHLRQIRLIVNDEAKEPIDCNLGFLDTLSIHPTFFVDDKDAFLKCDWLNAFDILLSSEQCQDLQGMNRQQVADALSHCSQDKEGFPI